MEFKNVVNILSKNINYYASSVSKNSGMEFEDAKQEILLRMFKASKKYDEKICKVNTYFITVIKRECMRLIKKNIERLRKEERLFINDEAKCAIFTVIYNGQHPQQKLIDRTINLKVFIEDKVLTKNLLDDVEKGLEKPYLFILQMLRKGYNLESISENMEWSKQRICNSFRNKIKPKIIQQFS